MLGRAVPSTLYIRERLKLLHGESGHPQVVILAHLVALVAMLALAMLGLVPSLVVAPMTILLWRATSGLRSNQRGITARRLGLREIAFGVVTVLATVVGHAIE
jgi:hypothetical protein